MKLLNWRPRDIYNRIKTMLWFLWWESARRRCSSRSHCDRCCIFLPYNCMLLRRQIGRVCLLVSALPELFLMVFASCECFVDLFASFSVFANRWLEVVMTILVVDFAWIQETRNEKVKCCVFFGWTEMNCSRIRENSAFYAPLYT